MQSTLLPVPSWESWCPPNPRDERQCVQCPETSWVVRSMTSLPPYGSEAPSWERPARMAPPPRPRTPPQAPSPPAWGGEMGTDPDRCLRSAPAALAPSLRANKGRHRHRGHRPPFTQSCSAGKWMSWRMMEPRVPRNPARRPPRSWQGLEAAEAVAMGDPGFYRRHRPGCLARHDVTPQEHQVWAHEGLAKFPSGSPPSDFPEQARESPVAGTRRLGPLAGNPSNKQGSEGAAASDPPPPRSRR